MADGWIFLLSGGAILGVVLLAEWLRQVRGWPAEITRKLVHVLTALFVVMTPYLFDEEGWIYLLSAAFVLLNGLALRRKWFRGMHGIERFSIGTVTFPLALLLLLPVCWTLAPDRIFALQLAFLVMGIADPVASLLGRHWGRRYFRVGEGTKSLEGSLAFFLTATGLLLAGGWMLGLPELVGVHWMVLVLLTATVATLAEAVGVQGWDNLLVAVVVAALLVVGYEHPEQLNRLVAGAVLTIGFMGVAYRLHLLNCSGTLAAGLLGVFVFGVGGWSWTLPILVFFIGSSLLSRWKRGRKTDMADVVVKGSRRDMGQVWANGGVPLAMLLGYIFLPHSLWYVAYVGALAAATADTWATEVGTALRGRTWHVLTWKEVSPGISGGVSLPGTLAGVAGALAVGSSAYVAGGPVPGNPTSVLLAVTIGGLTGAWVDSLVGATLQAIYRDPVAGVLTEHPVRGGQSLPLVRGIPWLDNDGVNVLCTLTGALVAVGFMVWFSA